MMNERRLWRETREADGAVIVRRLVLADGSLEPSLDYISADGFCVWHARLDETLEAFERRTIRNAALIALERGEPILLLPTAL